MPHVALQRTHHKTNTPKHEARQEGQRFGGQASAEGDIHGGTAAKRMRRPPPSHPRRAQAFLPFAAAATLTGSIVLLLLLLEARIAVAAPMRSRALLQRGVSAVMSRGGGQQQHRQFACFQWQAGVAARGGGTGGVRGMGWWSRPVSLQQQLRSDVRGRVSSVQPMLASIGTRKKTTGVGSGGGGKDPSSSPSSPAPAIVLSAEERELFETLLSVVEDEQLGTTLRVAGGWVRDKVLGQWAPDGHVDIDIALDNMMGSEFAATLNRWLAKRGRQVMKVGIISQNPDKSKHLETATMRVGPFWIDFVNLRTESYTEGSRIPAMGIGGPEEDALRRDLTINSLFYNVNTGEVEDFSGRGLADMRDGVIRTPLPALTTLLDDPLRVLRAVRFASRLDFRMSPELVAAASDPRVHRALDQKVSRERVGSEVDLMMRSARPTQAMALIGELGLADTVFPAPEGLVAEEGQEEEDSSALPGTWYRQGLTAMAEMEMGLRFKSWGLSAEEVRLALYAALLLPLAPVRYLEKKKKPKEVSRYIFARSLKLRAKDADKVALLHEVVDGFQPFLEPDGGALEPREKRARIGFLLIQIGPLWRAAVLLAAVKAATASGGDTPLDPEHSYREAAAGVYAYVTEARLDEVWAALPPFDGEALRGILPGIPHGPPFRLVMDAQVGMWLREPDLAHEEMRRRLVARFPEYSEEES